MNTEVDDKVFLWNLSPIVVENRIESIITQGQDVTSIAEAENRAVLHVEKRKSRHASERISSRK